jgi:hypothetical protein
LWVYFKIHCDRPLFTHTQFFNTLTITHRAKVPIMAFVTNPKNTLAFVQQCANSSSLDPRMIVPIITNSSGSVRFARDVYDIPPTTRSPLACVQRICSRGS